MTRDVHFHWNSRENTHPPLKIDLLKVDQHQPLKIDRGQIFEFWQFLAFFGLGRSRDQGDRFFGPVSPPSALVQRSADPNRIMFELFLGFGPLLKSRSPLKVDRI